MSIYLHKRTGTPLTHENVLERVEAHNEAERRSTRLYVALMALLLILALVFGWIVPSYFEARAFERVTGRHVGMWDAMWIELRVTEPGK